MSDFCNILIWVGTFVIALIIGISIDSKISIFKAIKVIIKEM